jgi:hypothetical protein
MWSIKFQTINILLKIGKFNESTTNTLKYLLVALHYPLF